MRRHLASSLLTIAGVRDGDTVFDPFMGSGTILREACDAYRTIRCIGVDEDAEAVKWAQATIGGQAILLHRPFQAVQPATLPEKIRLVSNLPFGVQFEQVNDDALLPFLASLRAQCTGIALLLAREQARRLAKPLDLRVRNVLVLGQPAAIMFQNG